MHNIGGGASHFLTPLIAVAVANAWGWRSAYLAMGIPTAVFGILFYLRLGQLNAREKANRGGVGEERRTTPFPAGKHEPDRHLPDLLDLHGGDHHLRGLVHPAAHGRSFPRK